MTISELKRIRAQANSIDWSASIIPDATIEDLDEEAIALPRKNFKKVWYSLYLF